MGKKLYRSFEDERLEEKLEEEEISAEAKNAWEVGRKLGLLSKISDDAKRRQIAQLEKEDRVKSRKSKKPVKSGVEKVC